MQVSQQSPSLFPADARRIGSAGFVTIVLFFLISCVADAGSIFPEITEGPKTQPVICGADGNVKRISDRSGTREMDWDHGRLTTTEYLNGSLVLAGYQLTNSYDKGRRTGVTLTKNGVPIHQVSFERGNYLWNESQK